MSARLLTDLVPLRQTTDWQSFREPKSIPHRYNETSGELLQYDAARLTFVWADHASEGIDRVYVNDVEVTNWSWHNGLDSTGRTVTFVIFNSPPDDTATIYAAGRGKLNPRTGQRFQNPADIVWDVLANIAGFDIAYARLIPFKNACTRLNISVSGSVDDATLSLQAQIRIIGGSIGAVFCSDSVQFLQIYPGGPESPVRQDIDRRWPVAATANQGDIVNNVIINFDFLNGKAKQSIEMEAPASVAQFGKKQQQLDAVWLTDLRTAFAVAQRYLQHKARTQWTVAVAGLTQPLLVGDWVSFSHPLFTVEGAHMVTARNRDLGLDETAITVAVPSGPVPGIVLKRSVSAFDPLQYPSVDIVTRGGNRILTYLNSDGSPIVDAAVTLDNTITHYTDGGGVVTFSVSLMPPGNHLLAVKCTDGREFAQTVLVT